MKYFKWLLIILICFVSCKTKDEKKQLKTVRVSFSIDTTKQDLKDLFIYFISSDSSIIPCTLKHDTLVFPNFVKTNDSIYNVKFVFNKYILTFKDINKKLLANDDQDVIWNVGVDFKPFDKIDLLNFNDLKDTSNIVALKYWIFDLQEYDDGIYFVEKVYKNK